MKKIDLKRKVKYAIWIPRKITRKPASKGAVISDLFPLRSDTYWQTHFELLDVSGLISGDVSLAQEKSARFVFFNSAGSKLAEKLIAIPSSGRSSIALDNAFDSSISKASSFAVFHEFSDQTLEKERVS